MRQVFFANLHGFSSGKESLCTYAHALESDREILTVWTSTKFDRASVDIEVSTMSIAGEDLYFVYRGAIRYNTVIPLKLPKGTKVRLRVNELTKDCLLFATLGANNELKEELDGEENKQHSKGN